MILTGDAIKRGVTSGTIVIDPFDAEQVSENAYDWRLGASIWECIGPLDAAMPGHFVKRKIGREGLILEPNVLYLGVTHERTKSDRYAQLINGNVSVGSLGIWVHVSAPLGHVGHGIRWTLEIRVVQPVRVYAGMIFGKIVFIDPLGDRVPYSGEDRKYSASLGVDESRLYEEFS